MLQNQNYLILRNLLLSQATTYLSNNSSKFGYLDKELFSEYVGKIAVQNNGFEVLSLQSLQELVNEVVQETLSNQGRGRG